jgi:hypothetical protein
MKSTGWPIKVSKFGSVNAKFRVIKWRAYGLRDKEYARRRFIEAGLRYFFYVDEWLKPPP